MNKSKRKSATVFSRDEIGVEQLQSLKEKFADGDLNEKEFVSLFREIIDASLSETQLTELFQKIDANSDGTVDWDELTNYMFLSGSDNSTEFLGGDSNAFYETYQPEKLGEVQLDSSGSSSGGGCASGSSSAGGAIGGSVMGSDGLTMRPTYFHKDLITRVIRLEKPYMYLTASKDGSVRTWNAHTMQYQNVLATGKNWITDCCVMRRSNRLAVTSMNRTLGIYDLGSNSLIGEINEYSKRQAIPLCVEYVEKPADDREALVIGDDTGGITVMTCSNQWMACDGRSSGSTATAAASGGGSSSTGSSSSSSASSVQNSTSSGVGSQTNAAGSASLEAQGFSSRVKFKKHTDWVTRVKWVNDIRAVVATSLDTNISIIDIDRMVVKFEYNRHKKGVFDLAWCSSTRLIASCGMERDISIWNPYSSQRAVATLRGHTSSVVHLVSDDDNYQIISVASDNTFKVWDVRNHRCLQTWCDRYKSTGGAENRISALLFDPKQPCLVSGTTHLTRWQFKVQNDEEDEGDDVKEKPMCIASYNAVFHQVVTAEMSAESVVKTWSVETGDELCSFSNAHGQNPVTAISFDYPGRRLLTGSHDGALIKMWNFSNGALVKQFLKDEDSGASTNGSGGAGGVTSGGGDGGSSAGSTSAGGGTAASLANDLSFLGIDSGDGNAGADADSGTNTKKGKSAASGTVVMPVSPRKRNKVRDIMLLPPTFGIDLEGRRNASALGDYAELPSPTRTRLQPKEDREKQAIKEMNAKERRLSAVPPKASHNTSNQLAEAASAQLPMPPPNGAPTVSGRTPRARHSTGSASIATRADSCVEFTTSTSPPKANKYTEKEVTSILDIERNLRVGMGDYICQRFVCCVGWDRNIFVWADKNDESEAMPIHVLPTQKTLASNPNKCHTMDILALVYIPPAYIATAGLDGSILLWSINSGDFLSCVYQSSGSIDAMFYAQKIEVLFASGETGQLICIDRSMTPRAALNLDHPHDEAVTALRCDRTNTHLVTGDAMGYIKVWDLSVSPDHEGLLLDVCCLWRVPGASARVLGLDFVEHVRVSEPYLLVSSGNGDVTLWTLDGVQIGSFGKHRTWQLGRPSTYLASYSSCIWPSGTTRSADSENDVRDAISPSVLAATATKRQFTPCFSIAMLSGNETARETFLLEDSMPKPGEVWVCVSGHRSTRGMNMSARKAQEGAVAPADSSAPSTPATGDRDSGRSSVSTPSTLSSGILPAMFRRSSNNSGGSSFMQVLGAVVMRETLASPAFLQQRMSEMATDITDIITVVKVTRGEISCWDGNGHKPPLLKIIEMSEFVRKAGWVKQPLLSQYIGRMFSGDQAHYRVSGISVVAMDPNKPDRKTVMLIDTNGQDHSPKPLSEAVSTARVKVAAQLQQQQQQQFNASAARGANARQATSTTRKRLLATPTSASLKAESGLGKSTSTRADASSHGAADSDGSGQAATASVASLPATTVALTTSVTAINSLPLVKIKDKRAMGGLLPKRSSVRMRHDQSVDFRRVHAPEDVPKNFRVALHQRLQSSLGGGVVGSVGGRSTTSGAPRTSHSGVRFDGVIPE